MLDRARLDYVPDVGEGFGIVGRGTGAGRGTTLKAPVPVPARW